MKKHKVLKIYGEFNEAIFALFCVYCLLNNKQIGKFNQKSKTFRIVRKFAKDNKIILDKKLVKIIQKDHPSYFILRVIRYGNNFVPIGPKHELEKDESWYENFDILLKSFYFSNKFPIAKKECEPYYQKQIDRILPKVRISISKTNRFLKINPVDLGLRELAVIPNQIDRTRNGYGFRIGSRASIIFSQNLGVRFKPGLFIHEYLHSIINPMFQKPIFRDIIQQSKKYSNQFISDKNKKYYPKWEFILIEYVIRTIEGWQYSGTEKEKYLSIEEKERGFIKIREFDKYLARYQNNTSNLEEFLQKMLCDSLII